MARVRGWLAAALALGLAAGAASAQDHSPGPVQTAEGTLYASCIGEARPGAPTVIFENGLGEGLETWEPIHATVAEWTRACAYDRLGVRRSTPVEEPDTRTPFELARTLHDGLLPALGVEGPIILVGHSIAGLILLAYPHLFPDDVAGMVFVDASHPDQFRRFQALNGAADAPAGPLGGERIDRLAAEEELSAVGDFGDLPIRVLHQAAPTDRPQRAIWIEFQQDHASRSTDSRVIPGLESGHYVHRDQPELVLAAIRELLEGG